MEIRNHGFIAPVIDKEKDFFLGGLRSAPFEILQESGQWDEFVSWPETQHNKVFDSYNCTGYGTLNVLEVLMLRKFGKDFNFSERYTGICAGTYPPGNSPQVVIESIRKDAGLLDEFYLSFTSQDTEMTLDQYYSPKPMDEKLANKGKKFLEEYKIQHDWVYQSGEEANEIKLKNALKSSPLGVSVMAWRQNGEYYVKEPGEQDTHWTILYGYEDGKYWKCYDSYEGNFKKLAWNYPFGYVKRYYLEKIIIQKKTLWQRFLEILNEYNILKIWRIGLTVVTRPVNG